MRLDVAMVAQGHSRSRNRAAALINDGLVQVNGVTCTKASSQITQDDAITVNSDHIGAPFASRASYKLLRALEAIPSSSLRIEGSKVLDVGASTGGFTDVALRWGATHVVALDVGHDQLVPELRNNDRVTVIEGYNARTLVAEDLPFKPDIVVCDVSFISLTLLIPAIAGVCTSSTELLLMVKPQFEVGKQGVSAGGVVRDPHLQAQAIQAVASCGQRNGLGVRAIIPSALPGPHGNREFFVWFSKSAVQSADLDIEVCDTGDSIEGAHYEHPSDSALDVAIRKAVQSTLDTPTKVGVSYPERSKSLGIPHASEVPSTHVFWI